MAGHSSLRAVARGEAISRAAGWAAPLVLALAAGCATTANKAPVFDRATTRAPVAAPRPATEARPDTYIVKRGDTLYSIALDNGLDYRELAEWNAITDPHVIQAGQELRLKAPETIVQVQPATGGGAIETRPLGADAPAAAARPAEPAPQPRAAGQPPLVTGPKALKLPWSEENVASLARGDAGAAPAPGGAAPRPELAKPAPVPAPAPQASQAPEDGGDKVDWAWPASGRVLAGFSEATNKGVDIAGKVGDPVLASASGRVVYSGQGLRGYGKLIIIKHNNTYLSAYAHNSNLLVKEGQSVVRGQKIAEIGSTDATQAKLHFEIRRLGKPIDPAKLLPERPS
jgi:lipoprotein NlpD